jgi:hypothetical protein
VRSKKREKAAAFRVRSAKGSANHLSICSRAACCAGGGNVAIDEEHVTGLRDDGIVHAIAIYETHQGLITKAWFVR